MQAGESAQVRSLLREAASRLGAAGVGSPRTDSELLLAHVLECERGRLYLLDVIDTVQAERYRAVVERRAAREPLQHITGSAWFLDLDLQVGPGVFVPRPETETLAQWGIDHIAGLERPTVVDLCSGSGALALAVARARPDAEAYAVEVSPEALEWLGRNAFGTRVRVVPGDVRDPDLLAEVRGQADLVLCNPPYVPAAQRVPVEVRADPPLAVFAGVDGLDLIPVVAELAADLLRDGGRAGIEHDESHPEEVARILGRHFRDVRGLPDLAGRPRFTTGVK
ncbi:peptide chain release factor N(5)-glutamine methyltransferase [Hamadaea flava]|uniref:Release factor glutamine methyltransferase n=1 Tax=Hamadaea flava TaxID=1742688 RepID=A0ABV8LK87_9ACTN|nr:peptide chain release factor N(5)-glutamine methyltransferase [Hamadaea flava]